MKKTKVISSGPVNQKTKPKCPHCNADADGLTGLSDKSIRPGDGSITICVYCSTVSKIKISRVTGEFELEKVPDHDVSIMQATDENFRFLLLYVKDRIKNKK